METTIKKAVFMRPAGNTFYLYHTDIWTLTENEFQQFESEYDQILENLIFCLQWV